MKTISYQRKSYRVSMLALMIGLYACLFMLSGCVPPNQQQDNFNTMMLYNIWKTRTELELQRTHSGVTCSPFLNGYSCD